MTNDGDNPASASTRASIDEVVVLPWVPDTAIVRLVAAMAASTSARLSTGMPRSRATRTSGFESGTAVDVVTASAEPRFDARWPM